MRFDNDVALEQLFRDKLRQALSEWLAGASDELSEDEHARILRRLDETADSLQSEVFDIVGLNLDGERIESSSSAPAGATEEAS